MADMMTFPETVEEFMDQYKITDTEQIYTNGAELVPIFRMKQWFNHKPEQRWIPTKIAKPPKAGQYLVTKQQKTGACQIATAHYNPSFDEWSGNGNFTKVLAWQQLPSPYTQE